MIKVLTRTLILCAAFLFACKKDSHVEPQAPETKEPTTPLVNDGADGPLEVYPEGQAALDIVYFLPSDCIAPLGQYQKRLSFILCVVVFSGLVQKANRQPWHQ